MRREMKLSQGEDQLRERQEFEEKKKNSLKSSEKKNKVKKDKKENSNDIFFNVKQ
jgi:hypothetical protein